MLIIRAHAPIADWMRSNVLFQNPAVFNGGFSSQNLTVFFTNLTDHHVRKPLRKREVVRKKRLEDATNQDERNFSLPSSTGCFSEFRLEVANGFLTVSSVDKSEPISPSPLSTQDQNLLVFDYVKLLSPDLDLEDIQFLTVKGALWMPTWELRDALLCSYLDFVHPFLPILDLSQILEMFKEQNTCRTSRVSILLFQAVIFAASAFVEEKLLTKNGFTNRRIARREMYQRIKLLVEFKVETDKIAYIQSLLLMTYWYESPDDPKSMYHWMGMAVTMADEIELHRDPELLGYEEATCRQRKRLWWSCIMRDSAISLGIRQRTKIGNEDYDVPMLTLDDFNTEPLPFGLSNIAIQSEVAQDAKLRKRLAILCIEKAKLCLILREVLSVQYTIGNIRPNCYKHGVFTKSTMGLLPRINTDDRLVKTCELSILKWEEELPEETKYQSHIPENLSNSKRIFQVHLTLFHMLYHATIITFYRPWTVYNKLSSEESLQSILARKATRRAATEISEIVRDLYHIKGTYFLPLTGISTLLAATISHISDASVGNRHIQGVGVWHLDNCFRSIQLLRGVYPLADHAACVIQAAVSGSQLCDGKIGDNLPQCELSRKSGNSMTLLSTGDCRNSTSARVSEARATEKHINSVDINHTETSSESSKSTTSDGNFTVGQQFQYHEDQLMEPLDFGGRWGDISLDQNEHFSSYIDQEEVRLGSNLYDFMNWEW
ncbi:fungal-specific transcription factor domain-containing protein [Xylogone sp. PMI_703]|nr:fungal-specific transcription factor domain-containing protein [Xylogone sp. PMI_703]